MVAAEHDIKTPSPFFVIASLSFLLLPLVLASYFCFSPLGVLPCFGRICSDLCSLLAVDFGIGESVVVVFGEVGVRGGCTGMSTLLGSPSCFSSFAALVAVTSVISTLALRLACTFGLFLIRRLSSSYSQRSLSAIEVVFEGVVFVLVGC